MKSWGKAVGTGRFARPFGALVLLLGLWTLSPEARATCSTSHNRVDDPETPVNENSDDLFVLRHGLVTELGTDTVYGGGDGDGSYLGYTRDQGYIEISGRSSTQSGGIHGATADGTSASLGRDGGCVNDNHAP